MGQSAVNRVIVVAGRRFRARRMARFARVLDGLSEKRILDIGGSERFWRPWPGADVTLLNVHFIDVAQRPRIQVDATSTGLCDDAYDIAFSNSVVEHLGTWERQKAFAREFCHCQAPLPVERAEAGPAVSRKTTKQIVIDPLASASR
jgi:hypothetical protein